MIEFTLSRKITLASLSFLYLAVAAAAQSPGPAITKSYSTHENRHTQGSSTVDGQTNNPADRELTRNIRQAIVADKSLSTYAHNIKIVTQGGTVTLKGPIRKKAERTTLEARAKKLAGAYKVVCQLTVARKGGSNNN